MNKQVISRGKKNIIFQVAVFLLVLTFTFILRAHNFDRIPAMGHLEEQMFAWAGINLIERGIPRAWSSLDFPERAIVSKGAVSYQGGDPKVYVNMVEPWLEQPPLFSLLVGSFAHLYQANRDQVIPTSFIRTPVIIASIYNHEFLKKITKFVLIIVIIIGIYISVIYIYNVFELNCESISCPLGPSTELSTIHSPFIWRWLVLGEPKLR